MAVSEFERRHAAMVGEQEHALHHTQQLKQLNATLSSELSDAKDEHGEVTEKLRAEHRTALDRLRSGHSIAVSSHEHALSLKEAEHGQALASLEMCITVRKLLDLEPHNAPTKRKHTYPAHRR